MLSGAQLFEGFDDALRRASAEAEAAERELAALTARRDGLRGQVAATLRELARHRLGAIQGASPLTRLDNASERVRALLADRSQAVAEADRVLEARNAALDAARERSRAATAALAAAEQAAAAALEAARARFAQDAEWRRLSTALEEARRTATLARQKADLATLDQAEKGKPYLADALFRYLWNRGYGTTNYRAGPLVRWLDGWVARVAGFEPARRSYALLTALPAGLAAHAERMAEAVAPAAAALAAYERRFAQGADAPDLERLRREQDEAEDAFEAAQEAANQAAGERATRATGDDPAMREAMAMLEAALGEASLRDLQQAAARTPTRDDDALVARLEAARTEGERLEWRLNEQRRLAAEARERLDRLQETRVAARQEGYNRGGFDVGSAVVGSILGEVMRGALNRGGFLDRMQRHRVPGPWGGPFGGPAPGPWGGGTGGGFGGDGGFRTGGSFGGDGGGGGFRSGGSF